MRKASTFALHSSALFLLISSFSTGVFAQGSMQIYTDSLGAGWENWSWDSTIDFGYSGTVYGGTDCISVTINSGYAALSLHHANIDTSSYTNLSFWIRGATSGGQQLRVSAQAGTITKPAVALAPLTTTWTKVNLSMAALGISNVTDFNRFAIQNATGSALPAFYVDDISLDAGPPPPPTTNQVAIHVDAQLNRRAIDPMIYGVCFASTSELLDLNFTANRSGGNAETRYNWLLNAHNRAADWYFESLADDSSTPGAEADTFISNTRNGGAEPLISVPMIEWMPKLGPGRERLSSYSIAKYGAQKANDWQWFPDAGNGVRLDDSLIVTNDKNDANFLTNSAFQEAWVRHLTNQWGSATNGGVRFYILDNEHSIWHSTHRDVHPTGATMEEIRDKMILYGTMIKSNDPHAITLGPEEFGWSGFMNSGYDLWSGTSTDRDNHGGMDYMPWLLSQLGQYYTNTGKRVIDYFTLHLYTEANMGTDFESQNLRSRLTRKFWDPTYVDETWVNTPIRLIPRMKEWVDQYCPGAKTGITEYNWGAEDHINGATAQADILGIFGKHGLDLATRWTTPAPSTPTYKAMKMYRNYDGNKSTFGDTSVYVNTPDANTFGIYAAERAADGALTIMAINKHITRSATYTVNLTNFTPTGVVQRWQLNSNNVISHLTDISVSGSVFSNTVNPQTITLYVLPAAAVVPPGQPTLTALSLTSSNTFLLRLDGEAGRKYAIDGANNLQTWIPKITNQLAGTFTNCNIAAPDLMQFYRARWVP